MIDARLVPFGHVAVPSAQDWMHEFEMRGEENYGLPWPSIEADFDDVSCHVSIDQGGTEYEVGLGLE
jgi:hypothetical protein